MRFECIFIRKGFSSIQVKDMHRHKQKLNDYGTVTKNTVGGKKKDYLRKIDQMYRSKNNARVKNNG